MDKRDLQSSAGKIKKVSADVMARARPRPRSARTRWWWFVAGLLAGAAALFLFDPRRGSERRHMLVDQVRARGADAVELGGRKARHLRNKAAGAIAERRSDSGESLEETGTT